MAVGYEEWLWVVNAGGSGPIHPADLDNDSEDPDWATLPDQ